MTKQNRVEHVQRRDLRGTAQRDDALRSHEKALKTQEHLPAFPRLKEKQASMKQDHPKPKYRQR